MGRTHWGDPADPPGQQQGRSPKATGLSPARLHQGPWQTSPGAMEATVDRRAGTQSRRGSPAEQRGPATQATRVRPSYIRLVGAIPLVVRDTPHGWAAPRAAAQRKGHVALRIDTCGETLPPGTPGPGGRDTAFPSTCGSGLRGTSTRAVGGTGRPLGKTFFLHRQRRHLEVRRYLPTYLYLNTVTGAKGVYLTTGDTTGQVVPFDQVHHIAVGPRLPNTDKPRHPMA